MAGDGAQVLVLPTPLRPITQVISPGSASSDTPRSAWLAP